MLGAHQKLFGGVGTIKRHRRNAANFVRGPSCIGMPSSLSLARPRWVNATVVGSALSLCVAFFGSLFCVPCVLRMPHSSQFWSPPSFHRLFAHASSEKIVPYMPQYGCAMQEATLLAGSSFFLSHAAFAAQSRVAKHAQLLSMRIRRRRVAKWNLLFVFLSTTTSKSKR